MSEAREIAAPLGEEAWDDTALLDVGIEKSDNDYRHSNVQWQLIMKRTYLKKTIC